MRVYTNLAREAVLAVDCDNVQSTLELDTVDGWLVPGTGDESVAALDFGESATVEVVTYTGITGTTLTGVTRGVDGTAAASHLADVSVRHIASAADVELIHLHAARHQNGGADEISVAGLSGELADPQPPKAHASSHEPGGGDPMAVDAVAETGSMRTLGSGAQQAAAGDHAHGDTGPSATDAEQNVRLWELEAATFGTVEGFTGWQGEGFLTGQDEVATLTDLAITRNADLDVGSLTFEAGDMGVWTSRTSAADNDWGSVTWSAELSLFVAVAYSGTGDRVMTSPDGIVWTSRTSAADNSWYSVTWSAELSLFVAVAVSGTGDRVMTSPDGIVWTLRTSAADNNWRSVTWSAELSLFVAVAASGTGDRVMTSPDGIVWTSRTSAADNNWRSVTWSAELSLFVAVAYSGTGDRVMTSPDGIVWTLQSSAADNAWFSVTWSAELSLFVAVAVSGTGDRVMTSEAVGADSGVCTLDTVALPATANTVYLLDQTVTAGSAAVVYEATLDGGTTWETVTAGQTTTLGHSGTQFALRASMSRTVDSGDAGDVFWMVGYAS